jgi:hypothetical protein
VGVAGVPLAPSGGEDVGSHLGVHVDDGGVGAPGSGKPDVGLAGFGGEAAVVEDEGAVLVGAELALRGEVAAGVVEGGVDLAVVEDGVAVAVDEVDVAGDDAVCEVAAGWERGAGRGCGGVGGGGSCGCSGAGSYAGASFVMIEGTYRMAPAESTKCLTRSNPNSIQSAKC